MILWHFTLRHYLPYPRTSVNVRKRPETSANARKLYLGQSLLVRCIFDISNYTNLKQDDVYEFINEHTPTSAKKTHDN